MTDLAVLAIGFGIIPLAAILLYSFRGFVLGRREAVWGSLAGVVAFLALGHAMAAVLVNKPLFGDALIAIAVAVVGLVVGSGIAWLLMEGPFIRTEGAESCGSPSHLLVYTVFGLVLCSAKPLL